MSELTHEIGAFDANTRTVPVTFTSGEITHSRDVNAVLKNDGSYDAAGTAVRVDDVARGVAQKIKLGVIGMPQPDLVAENTVEPAAQ